jgi:hypothetical protein
MSEKTQFPKRKSGSSIVVLIVVTFTHSHSVWAEKEQGNNARVHVELRRLAHTQKKRGLDAAVFVCMNIPTCVIITTHAQQHHAKAAC